MKRTVPQCLIITLILFQFTIKSTAQCTTGWNSATVNWEQLDYLTRLGTYSAFVTAPMRDTQYFAFGVNRVKIQLGAGITTNGENVTNTAESPAVAANADVEYGGQGTITLTFDTVVRNLQFSLFDIDLNQRANITATDGAGNPTIINMALITAGTITVTGNGTNSATASANGTSVNNTDTRATVNITIPGAAAGVKSVRITLSNASDVFWMGDLTACIFGSFPNNYYISQKPFTGQPAYYLVTPDNNSVYLFNPLTGKADWLFSESQSPWINSVAYDHVHKIVYYVRDNPSPVGTNKMLKKYDMNTETNGVVVNDITTLGIPLYDIVVESAGAAFYNGSLFLGVEGTNSGKNSNRESMIWRIDFDPITNQPSKVCQVFARPADNGSGTLTHDWGDFTIKDGVLYDFNTGNVGSTSQFVHFNMQSGATAFYNTNGNPAPIQAGQTWDGKLYWTGGQSPETGRVALYNENGTIGVKVVASATACSPAWVGRAGDASDPFKPKSDFGDAPASYDPTGIDPATHEYDCNLRLGATFDREWDKTVSADATADGSDEDGITTVSLLSPGLQTYVQPVQVYNRTGAAARLVAWLDYNANGLFEAGEGQLLSIPNSTAVQTVNLTWANINVTMMPGTSTFMRIRVASAASLTTSMPNGWFANGEVEDYRVMVTSVLPIQLLSFDAKNDNGQRVLLQWKSENEIGLKEYEIERSHDGIEWIKLGAAASTASGSGAHATAFYDFYDNDPSEGKQFYRLKMVGVDGYSRYGVVVAANISTAATFALRVKPNPVNDVATIQFNGNNNEAVAIYMVNAEGKRVLSKSVTSREGLNQVSLQLPRTVVSGIYVVQVVTPSKAMNIKALVQRK